MQFLGVLRDFSLFSQDLPDRPFWSSSAMLSRGQHRNAYSIIEKEVLQMRSELPIRVLIVDDNAIFLNQLEKWLSTRPGFVIVGKAYSGMEAIEQSRVLCPALVVMDIAMPLINGYEAAAKITKEAHHPMVILISFFDIQDVYPDSGPVAHAFIRKDSLYEELLPTVARLFPSWGVINATVG